MKDMKELIEAIEDFSCCSGGCCGHAELKKALELAKKMEEDTEDDNPSNMLVRAGYLLGLSMKHQGEDREMLRLAARSLRYAVEHARTWHQLNPYAEGTWPEEGQLVAVVKGDMGTVLRRKGGMLEGPGSLVLGVSEGWLWLPLEDPKVFNEEQEYSARHRG